MSEDDRQQISAIVEQYRRGFATMDVAALKAIWDQDYDNLVYVASERPVPITSWQGISGYYDELPSGVPPGAPLTMRVDEMAADVLGDAAYVLCTFHYEGEQEGHREPVVFDGRVTFILRRRNSSWKVIHYHESTTR